MSIRPSVSDRPIHLPPAFSLVTLRESGDAFAHAYEIAAERGAGTLVWVRRFDLAEFAVVLEPHEPLATARRAFYAGMNALADALAAHAPPERPITFAWPDAVKIDGVLIGGGRLGWPEGTAEDDVPDWLVFAAMVRTFVMRAGDPGFRPLFGSLDELGFESVDGGDLVASFAPFLMSETHDWNEGGAERASRRWLARAEWGPEGPAELAENGDILIPSANASTTRRDLRDALLAPSWRDPATGAPWL